MFSFQTLSMENESRCESELSKDLLTARGYKAAKS